MIKKIVAMAVMLVPIPVTAFALTGPSVIVNPARPDQNSIPRKAPQHALPVPGAAAQAPRIQPFLLRAVQVQNSSLSAADFAAAAAPFVGRTIDSAGLQQLSAALSQVYDRSDIALYSVVIPGQDFSGGELHAVAVEGYIADAPIGGDASGRDMSLVNAYVAKLEAERPLRRATLQRYVSLMRDIPGLDLTVKLVNGDTLGVTRLLITVNSHPVQVAAALDSRGTAYLGHVQVELDGFLNSVLQQGDQTRATFAFPTDFHLFQYYGLSQAEPIGGEGLLFQISAGYLETRPEIFNLRGHAESLGFQFNYPLIRSFTDNLYLSAGLDGIDADNALLGQTFSDERTRALRAAASYSWSEPGEIVNLIGSMSFGVDILGARVGASDGSQINFTKFSGKALYNRALTEEWILKLAAAGQYSGDRLLASEQFALGGDEFGRGYEAAVLTGDSALAGSVELAYRPAGMLPELINGSEFYVFADAGKRWRNPRLGTPSQDAHLASVGTGMRILVDATNELDIEAAKGLNDPIPNVHDGWRVIFQFKTLYPP